MELCPQLIDQAVHGSNAGQMQGIGAKVRHLHVRERDREQRGGKAAHDLCRNEKREFIASDRRIAPDQILNCLLHRPEREHIQG